MIGLGISLRPRGAPRLPAETGYVARYWRLFFPYANPVTPADYIAVGRVWMYRKGERLSYESATGFDQSSMYSNRSARVAFQTTQNVPATPADSWTCSAAGMQNQWIKVDFGIDAAIDEIVVLPVTYNNRTPETIVVQASSDGATWQDVGALQSKWGSDSQAIQISASS